MTPIYLDHNATTPIDPRVQKVMLPYISDHFGNASSSSHAYGWRAQMGVEKARTQVAQFLNCSPKEVIFTSGATESNNLAIVGSLLRLMRDADLSQVAPHFITSNIEHKAVLEVFDRLKLFGAQTTILEVDSEGLIDPEDLKKALRKETHMVSLMGANNEIGTIQPITEFAEICKDHGALFHTDCAQLLGREKVDFKENGFSMLSLSGHKIYGPKGVGALLVKESDQRKLCPLVVGGEQEKGLRPGTLNVAGIVGLGEACQIMSESMGEEVAKLKGFQTRLFNWARDHEKEVLINGSPSKRLCNNVSLSFRSKTPDQLRSALSQIAYSSGSACSSSNPKPSYVITALGRSPELARQTVRFGMGRRTTPAHIESLLSKLSSLF